MNATAIVLMALGVSGLSVIALWATTRMMLVEQRRLVSAVIAKSGQELALLDRGTATKIPERKLPKADEFEIPFDEDVLIPLGLGG